MKKYNATMKCVLGACLLALTPICQAEENPPLGGMRLLDGFKHIPHQGIDSQVGEITKEGGLKIEYSIGRVARAGSPAMGGDYTDATKLVKKEHLSWYKEQIVSSHPIHIAYLKDQLLIVSFPSKGANFRVKITSADEMAEALLMILTFADEVKPK